MKRMNWVWGLIAGCVMAMSPAHAQWAVIDVASIQQLMVQIEYWKQQIDGMQAHLDQLKKTHAARIDRRGRVGHRFAQSAE